MILCLELVFGNSICVFLVANHLNRELVTLLLLCVCLFLPVLYLMHLP